MWSSKRVEPSSHIQRAGSSCSATSEHRACLPSKQASTSRELALVQSGLLRWIGHRGTSGSLRKSRTLSHHLLGSSDLGETSRANTSLLLVLLVAGAVGGLVIIIGMFFVCRSTQKIFEGSDEEGSGRDRERLAPRQRQPKRESKA